MHLLFYIQYINIGKMKILEIIPQLSSGGAERFVVDLCNELVKQNDVVLLLFFDLKEFGFYYQDLSPKVHIKCLNKKRGLSLSLSFMLLRKIKIINPDIVHLHLTAITYMIPSIFLYRKCKYFMTVHNTADKEAGGMIGTIIRRISFKSQLVTPVTISEESRKSFKTYYKMDAPVIFNGRDIPVTLGASKEVLQEFNQYKKDSKTKVIINLARINVVKRQTMLAKVASTLYNEGYNFSILMIGNDKNEELVKEIQSYNCPVVYILGERHNPLEYLSLADAYCLCSSYEGMPISLIETLGVGTIPICTPVGGIVDIIKDGVNGFLAADLSEEALYIVLKHFLETPNEELQKMKRRVLDSYKPFSMKICAEKYEQLFIKCYRK